MSSISSLPSHHTLANASPNGVAKPLPPKRGPGRPKKTIESSIVSDGSYKAPPMVKRKVRELSPQRKLQIIEYILNTTFYDDFVAQGGRKQRCLEGLEYKGNYRPPTLDHLETYFKVSKSTLSGIWRNRHEIAALQGKRRRRSKARRCDPAETLVPQPSETSLEQILLP